MRDFEFPPRCELEICSSEFLHTAEMAEARRCELRHVFYGFMFIVLLRFVKEISFDLNMKTKEC
jgi:hypothetical protein